MNKEGTSAALLAVQTELVHDGMCECITAPVTHAHLLNRSHLCHLKSKPVSVCTAALEIGSKLACLCMGKAQQPHSTVLLPMSSTSVPQPLCTCCFKLNSTSAVFTDSTGIW